jgi:peptidoglycan LD-endopeptidase CwlK
MDARSEKNLAGVHAELQRVVRRAHDALVNSGTIAFIVTEGLRTPARQRELMAAGATRTLNSRHLTGHAVDLMATVAGKGRWDWPLYERLATAMKAAAQDEGVPIVWGGDWRTFKDGPHFELDRKVYP